MRAALINAIVWCAIALWLFPGAFWYVVGFWAVLMIVLAAMGVKWEDQNVTYLDSRDFGKDVDITIDGKKYSGKVYRDYDR